MSFKHLGAALILAFTTTTSILAQQTLSLEQCRNLAIENNKSLKIATAQEQVAHYQKKEALMQYFPKISASGTYLHFSDDLHLIGKDALATKIPIPSSIGGITIPPPYAGMPIGLPQEMQDAIYDAGKIDMSNYWILGASLTQPIFAGGRIVALNDIRSYAEQLAKTQKETKTADVIVEVDEAYWQVVSISNKKRLAESYVELLQKIDEDIETMVNEGVATKADRLSVSVRLNEAEMTLTKATNGLSLAKMLLCQLCGIDLSQTISLTDEEIKDIPFEKEDTSIPNIDEAINSRSEIRSLNLANKIYEKKERVAFAEFLPTAGVSLGYNWLKPNLHDGLQDNFNGMWNVAVNVKVPLNFISSSAKYNAAKAESKAQQFQLEDAKDKIVLQINQSAYKMNEAEKKLIAAKKNVEKADENLRYANAGFEEGVIASSDVLAAHTAWISAHSEMIDAQIDMKLCNIYLNRALGRKF